VPGAIQDVITQANFDEDQSSGFGMARGRIFAVSNFPWTYFVAIKTLVHYHARV